MFNRQYLPIAQWCQHNANYSFPISDLESEPSSSTNSLSQTPVIVSPALTTLDFDIDDRYFRSAAPTVVTKEPTSDIEEQAFNSIPPSGPPLTAPSSPKSEQLQIDPKMAEPPQRRYPLRNEHNAPTFTGMEKSVKEIKRYLKDIEALVGQCNVALTDEVHIARGQVL